MKATNKLKVLLAVILLIFISIIVYINVNFRYDEEGTIEVWEENIQKHSNTSTVKKVVGSVKN